MQQPNVGSGGPIIDSNLLAQIQTLTNQLLSKTEGTKPDPGGFNTVRVFHCCVILQVVSSASAHQVSIMDQWLKHCSKMLPFRF